MTKIEFGLSVEFPDVPQDCRQALGCACQSLDKIWLLFDNILGGSNRELEIMAEQCSYCIHFKVEGKGTIADPQTFTCLLGIDNLMPAYIREINRALIHELLHIYGCTEGNIICMEWKLVPLWECPHFATIRKESKRVDHADSPAIVKSE